MTTSTCTHTATIARNKVTEASAKASSATARTMVPLPIHGTEREHSSLNVLESSDAGKPAHLTAEMVNGKRTLRPPAPLAARLPQRQRPANQAGTRVLQLWQKTVVVLVQARAIKPDPERKNPMKAGIVSLSVIMCLGVMGLGFASSITPAQADADDAAWIKTRSVSATTSGKARLPKSWPRGVRA